MPRIRIVIAAFAVLALLMLPSTGTTPARPGSGVAPGHDFVPGEVLIKFKDGAQPIDKLSARAALQAADVHTFLSRAEQWKLGPGISVEQAIQRLQANPLVDYVEPNYVITADVVPNDPRLPELWGMINTGQTGGTPDADIDADLAWGVSTGDPNLVVAVIDTGMDYNHPDLAANVWTNPGEIPGNGIDDDGNGFIDDVHGYDFINNDGDPFDDHGHGTHTSGTIGAVGDNGIGVVGVNWHIKIMAAKFLSAGGSGSTADAVRAVDYTTMMGVALTSNSWGGGGYSQALYDAIANAGAHNIAFVAAAGNNGQNSDTNPAYPAAYDLANIISVAATDDNDQLASFSNWGLVSVDLGAPGVDVLSTLPGNSYGQLSGTSMATPHTAGVCALIRAVNPNIPVGQMKQVLLNATDPIPALAGKCVSGGRLNAFFAIAEPDTVPPGMIDDLATTDPGSNTMGLTWTATGDDGDTGTATFYEVRYSLDPISDANWDQATRAGNEPEPAPSGSAESMEVRNLDADTVYYFAMKAFDEWGNPGPISNLASGTTLPPPTGQVDPTSVSDELLTGQQSDHVVTLSNIGQGTLDFSIPPPALGEPMSQAPFLDLGKDEADPRAGDPVTSSAGGPDTFGYRWSDSDEPGGPAFSWTDISTTGTLIGVSGDDSTSGPIQLDFDFPFYGTLFDQIRVCTNGWLSFTSSATSYSNQPLPNAGAPENLVAPFWDDLKTTTTTGIYYQSFGTSAIVQWTDIGRYSGAGSYTFQAILDSSGAVTYQYLDVSSGDLTSATVGIQNSDKTIGLTVAFNQAYLHDGLAVRIAAIPQWLTASPTSGRLFAGQSKAINLHMNASGLEGGTYPGTVSILTNDPQNPVLTVDASLHVIGAPDIDVQPTSLAYGDVFVSQPNDLNLIVANIGTDTLHVTGIVGSDPSLTASPDVFDVPPHGSRDVTVTWFPSALGPFSGSIQIQSNDGADPMLDVPVTGNAIPTPIMVYSPTSFNETLYTGNQVHRNLTVRNTGGSDLLVDAAADLGNGQLIYVDDISPDGAGGPDSFGYRWKDSDESGGPAFNFIDISTTGTPITFSSPDDSLSAAIDMGMTFPFYGSNFTSVKVGTNGFLTFQTSETSSRLSNYQLPSTSGAAYMIGLFWDDLHLRSGNVRYENTGSSFIIQYTNVEKYSPSGYPLTFQVQLFQNGKILCMYQTMAGTLNSATIGIQDGTKTVGLSANYNANYVHDGLAVEFSRTPDWLAVTPSHATIPPGGQFVFDVAFDSTDRFGGLLSGAVVLTTNVPSQAEEHVPSQLTVIGAPAVGITPESYDYGTRFTGYSYPTSFQVVNTGTDVLNVSDVYADDPSLLVLEPATEGGENVPEAGFQLAPGASHLFTLTWTPTTPGALAANVHVISDDPTYPDKTMPVTGNGIPPPVAGWSPSSFSEDLMVGDVVHRMLHLKNTGGSDLTFVSQVGLLSGATVTVDSSPELKKDEPDTRPGRLGTGGPDMFGYTWRDSDQPGGPAFNWVDISGIGTEIPFASSDDSNYGPITIGFPFPFYGQTFSTIRAGTNGFLSFTSTSTSLTNYPLPSTSAPENLLAVFHDDLHRRNGHAYYWSDGNRFIVQYDNWDQYSPSGQDYNFQVILYRNGRIVYQYLSMTTGDLAGATIGIQNDARDDGLTVDYNTDYVHDNMAVEFRPPAGWLQLDPEFGTIPPGGSLDLDVTFDTTQLIGGNYSANIDLSTNDPAHAAIRVPVSLHTTGIPDIDAVPGSLTFPTTFIGFTSTLTTSIQNVGTDVLNITGVSVSGDFSQSGLTPPVSLPVGGSIPVTVTFAPTSAGTLTGELVVTSNDPDEPSITVSLQGDALVPPEIGMDPTAMSEILPPGGTSTQTLTMCNTGGSDLVWDGSHNTVSGASVTQYDAMNLGKEEADPRPGVLGSGGPDMFGYKWKDSDEPGGPTYGWVDISGIGTQMPIGSTGYCDDCNVGPFPIGFGFSFYGNTFTEFRASTNGWVSFTNTTTDYSNDPLPSAGGPENLLAVFWDDLVHRNGTGSEPLPSAMYYYNDGTRLIIQYQHMYRIANYTDDLNFEIILYPGGKVVYQYETMASSTLNSNTIGIQNATKDDGLMAVYNQNYVHDNMAIEFKALPEWLSFSPTSGVVPAGACADMAVTFDATDPDMTHGWHHSVMTFNSNDPYHPSVDVPVDLAVNNKPIAVPAMLPNVECTGNNSAAAMLDGTGSTDADGDPLTYSWSAPGITFDDPTSATPTATFPLGSTTVTLVVNDGFENSAPATVVVTVVDTIPPHVESVTASPDLLWPPNHQMVTVETTVVASDICDPIPIVTLVSATSSEPDDAQGGGDGNTTNDVQGADVGTSDFSIDLRAEREGKGTGRVYTLTYEATDHSNNTSATAAGTVDVPHDLGSVVEPIELAVSGKSATVVTWPAVTGAEHYDVIRGDLGNIRVNGSDFDLGPVTCIANGITSTSTAGFEDNTTPAPGQTFFYAVQFFDGIADSSYGSESADKARTVQPSGGDCP